MKLSRPPITPSESASGRPRSHNPAAVSAPLLSIKRKRPSSQCQRLSSITAMISPARSAMPLRKQVSDAACIKRGLRSEVETDGHAKEDVDDRAECRGSYSGDALNSGAAALSEPLVNIQQAIDGALRPGVLRRSLADVRDACGSGSCSSLSCDPTCPVTSQNPTKVRAGRASNTKASETPRGIGTVRRASALKPRSRIEIRSPAKTSSNNRPQTK
jgi:hypothetical protein